MRGMFVEVRVKVDPPVKLVTVPQEVVRPTGEVFVMRDGKLVVLRPRPYHAGQGIVCYEEGASGLVAGDRVVASLVTLPRDGIALEEAEAPRDRTPEEPAAAGSP